MTSSIVTQFPTARQEPVTKTVGRITYQDPYAWLQSDSPEVLDYQWAQDTAAERYLAALPGMATLREAARKAHQNPSRAVMGGQYRRRHRDSESPLAQ
jgi:protease II